MNGITALRYYMKGVYWNGYWKEWFWSKVNIILKFSCWDLKDHQSINCKKINSLLTTSLEFIKQMNNASDIVSKMQSSVEQLKLKELKMQIKPIFYDTIFRTGFLTGSFTGRRLATQRETLLVDMGALMDFCNRTYYYIRTMYYFLYWFCY